MKGPASLQDASCYGGPAQDLWIYHLGLKTQAIFPRRLAAIKTITFFQGGLVQ